MRLKSNRNGSVVIFLNSRWKWFCVPVFPEYSAVGVTSVLVLCQLFSVVLFPHLMKIGLVAIACEEFSSLALLPFHFFFLYVLHYLAVLARGPGTGGPRSLLNNLCICKHNSLLAGMTMAAGAVLVVPQIKGIFHSRML